MNRWSRIVLAIGLVATASWVGAAGIGFQVDSQESLGFHMMLSFGALLALVLVHGWVALFAIASERWVKSASGRASVELAATRRLAVGAASVALLAALLQFTLSNALYPARLQALPHALAGLASCLVLAAALIVEARALTRHGREIAALDR